RQKQRERKLAQRDANGRIGHRLQGIGAPAGSQPMKATPSAGDANKLEELYKDVWGHLPETLRQEMNQYAREQFMPKYGDLLKQYYATSAEKGRRNQGSGVRGQESGARGQGSGDRGG